MLMILKSQHSRSNLLMHVLPMLLLLFLLQTMYVAEWAEESGWKQGSLVPYGPLQLMPSAQVRGGGRSRVLGSGFKLPAVLWTTGYGQ